MKNLIIVIMALFVSKSASCQDISGKENNTYSSYILLQHFLHSAKNNPVVFSNIITPQWNSKLFNDQYNQLLWINKENVFYPVLVFDNRFVAQSIPMKYTSPNYMWISTQNNKSFGEEVVGNIVSNILSSKKHRFNVNNNNYNKRSGYYTAVGIKY